jgi:hypothetical protein
VWKRHGAGGLQMACFMSERLVLVEVGRTPFAHGPPFAHGQTSCKPVANRLQLVRFVTQTGFVHGWFTDLKPVPNQFQTSLQPVRGKPVANRQMTSRKPRPVSLVTGRLPASFLSCRPAAVTPAILLLFSEYRWGRTNVPPRPPRPPRPPLRPRPPLPVR